MICGKTYFQKRTLTTLFKEEKTYKCPSCNKKYKSFINYQTIPKELGLIHIYSIFLENYQINIQAFNYEINEIFNKIINNKKSSDLVLWIEDLTYDFLDLFDLLEDNIYIITNTPYFK